jgi:phosphohistidine phosphatase SixA
MKYIALVRHGDISGNELSPLGQIQASELGNGLHRLNVPAAETRIVSSPAIRAMQTAYGIAASLNIRDAEEEARLWSGPDGIPGSFEGLGFTLAEWARRLLAKCNLLILVTHYEICAEAPACLSSLFQCRGPRVNGLARGQGLLYMIDKNEHRML